ncbi:hypothetical protein V6N12_062025 [Hibiscus sabdariffa]|uniref:Uncharacterized protein n=1 Tax=Hibiscus sabdariffa TaxID=183260 RepID=A0ABR2E0E7_9ROSI
MKINLLAVKPPFAGSSNQVKQSLLQQNFHILPKSQYLGIHACRSTPCNFTHLFGKVYSHGSRDAFLWKHIGIAVVVNLEEETEQACLDSSHRWWFFNWPSKRRVDSNISVEVEYVPHLVGFA